MTTKATRPRWPMLVALMVLFAVTMLGVWSYILSRWSEIETVSPAEAAGAFRAARAAAGEGPPYVEISRDGTVRVHRELERPEPARLRMLHLLAWESESSRLVRVGFPFWFVRAKMTQTINLGTLTSVLAGDWKHLDLRVSEDDLALRGPGLILDHTLADGSRILLWTE